MDRAGVPVLSEARHSSREQGVMPGRCVMLYMTTSTQSQRLIQEQQFQAHLANQRSPYILTQWQQEGTEGTATPPADTGEKTADYDPQKDPNSETAIQTLQKERAAREAAERQLKELQKTFADIDPDIARRAQQTLEQAQQEREAQSKREAELESRFKQQYEPLLQESQKQAAEATQKYLEYACDVNLERAFIDCEGIAGEFEPCAPLLRRRVSVKPDATVVVMKDDGKTPDFVTGDDGTARPKTLKELVEELKKSKDYPWFARHFKGLERAGLGLNGDGTAYAGDPALSGLKGWERLNAVRTKQTPRR